MKNKLITKILSIALVISLALNTEIYGNAAFARSSQQEELASSEISNPLVDGDISTWDCIYFGHYTQEDSDGDGVCDNEGDNVEPIKWRVLHVNEDNTALLMSDKILDMRPFNETGSDESGAVYVTWENSTLRSWLNGYGTDVNRDGALFNLDNFLYTAFTTDELDAIVRSTVINDKNDLLETQCPNNTDDYVFILNESDCKNAEYGLADYDSDGYLDDPEGYINGKLAAKMTGYAAGKQCAPSQNSGQYWLLTPGKNPYEDDNRSSAYRYYEYVDNRGIRDFLGCNINSYNYNDDEIIQEMGVRPCLYINLNESSLYSYAGSVSSDGREESIYPVNNPIRVDGVTTWDTIYFGNYYQSEIPSEQANVLVDGYYDGCSYKYEPVKWRVLNVTDGEALVISDKVIELCNFWGEYNAEQCGWDESYVREWLNGYELEASPENSLINKMFNEDEKAAILPRVLANVCDICQSEETVDYLFLLSNHDIVNPLYGFDTDTNPNDCWVAKPTDYCDKISGQADQWGRQYTYILRTPGTYVNNEWITNPPVDGVRETVWYASPMVEQNVLPDGRLSESFAGIRPALYIDLDSDQWIYAGTVDSEGNVHDSGILCEHEYGEVQVITAATCYSTGTGYRLCSHCGNRMSVDLPMLPHNMSIVITAEIPSSCKEKGKSAIRKCEYCDYREGGAELPLADHTYDAGVVKKEASETEKGEKEYTCTVCGNKRIEEIPLLQVQKKLTTAKQNAEKLVDTSSLEAGEKIAGYYIKDPTERTYAKVNNKGVITPKKTGVVHITAFKWGKDPVTNKKIKIDVDTVEVNVVMPEFTVKSMVATYTNEKIDASALMKMYAEIAASQKSVTWKSSKTKVAEVDSSTGNVTIKGAGSAKISVVFENEEGGKVTKSFTVKVKLPKVAKKLTVATGRDKKIKVSRAAEDLAQITFTSENPEIATVDRVGMVHGVVKGDTTVITTVNGMEYKCAIKVK